ncbi:polysaccharide pyruvyl transferase family protein [Microbacterium sp. BWT-B31]|uniref:polysaccharide pyruvyl transferase family protein n=1 Tax=Microbacterium sp. BWT-B31 TaxID=3232072 RepID=UPI0035271C07
MSSRLERCVPEFSVWNEQRRVVAGFLHELRGQSVLRLPNPGNGGDALMTLGTDQALARAGVHAETIDVDADVRGRTVLLAGGGNLVPPYGDLRAALSRFLGRAERIVLLPHSVRGHEDLVRRLDHSVTVFVRDRASAAHLHAVNPTLDVRLSHDMAFHLDVRAVLEDDALTARAHPLSRSVLHDAGLNEQDLSTWPSVDFFRADGEAIGQSVRTDADISQLFAFGLGAEQTRLAAWSVLHTVSLAAHVNTDRLHVGIASALLGVGCTLYAGSYDENAEVFGQSLSDVPTIRFVGPRFSAAAAKEHSRPDPLAAASAAVTIVIPTLDSAAYLDIVLDHWRSLTDLPVHVFVDGKSVDETAAVARKHAAHVHVVHNPDSVVEGLIGAVSRQLDTPWVLRFDDDELPTPALLRFVREAIGSEEVDAWAFPRYESAVSPDGALLLSTRFDPFEHRQWRLYRRDRVSYVSTIHTPGFDTDGLRLQTAPAEAAMVHLQWAVTDAQRRSAKVERYDRRGGLAAGTGWRHLILPEEEPSWQNRFRRLYVDGFDRVAQRIALRFPALTVRYGVYRPGDGIDFRNATGAPFAVSGWSVPEDGGQWSLGATSVLRIPLSEPLVNEATLTVEAAALFDVALGAQRVGVRVNDVHVAEWTFDTWDVVPQTATIPAAVAAGSESLHVRFEIFAPVSPADLGQSADARALGMRLVSARVAPSGDASSLPGSSRGRDQHGGGLLGAARGWGERAHGAAVACRGRLLMRIRRFCPPRPPARSRPVR